jgi:myo-inositol-1(or 4)-monophosphatase
MKNKQKKLDEIVMDNITNGIILKMSEIVKNGEFEQAVGVSIKSDKSIVTIVDQFVSDLVKDVTNDFRNMHNISFFSEEDQESFVLPCLMLDPIDGTRELAKGEAECVLSLALIDKDGQGWGWLYNPFNGFEITSEINFVQAPGYHKDKLLGLASRSEFRKGFFEDIEREGIEITPRGSIAFKLGLLAVNSADFVISLSPKNLWDIAAGTFICWSRGIKLYQNGNEVTSLTDLRLDGPMLWCREEHLEKLRKNFKF